HALARSLSRQRGDPGLIALVVSAQFQNGAYRSVRVIDTQGAVVVERHGDDTVPDVPAWFARMLPVDTDPASAEVHDGERPVGHVEAARDRAPAQQKLWRSAKQALGWLLVLAVLGVSAAAFVLRRVGDVLQGIGRHAQTVAEGRHDLLPLPGAAELQPIA